MLRDFKFLRRNTGTNSNAEEVENVPVNPIDALNHQSSADASRPPLNAIQDPSQISRGISDQELGLKANKVDRTPTKPKPKYSGTSMLLHTPEKQGLKSRFGWAQKGEPQSSNGMVGLKEEGRIAANITTPRSTKVVGISSSSYSECTSAQNTPTKSVSKPSNPGFNLASGSRPPLNSAARNVNFAALSKGIPSSCSSSTVVNSVDVPYFELKEDPSFWMEHNVQVLIRIRPLNTTEKSSFGYSRCLKQESAQSITWIGQPETRFTFDHVACEAIDQETLFRMVGLPMVENCLSGYNSCMFAYGQTGSGKTYTMLGEIEELEVKPSPNRGMTPRIFEFLFARIRAEEESRGDERLKYYCKCSFLEIYNEQITDLLDPSSTNLMLREDMKKGVYVENLSEFEVQTVGDILQLLSQGSSNRKVAATNMNRESSRSHSVFTCVIESRWEKDSTTNFRFARLNLVDLAGSERQKSSGAEGERLKEAANINKSLSTLGHVIMVLVDVANGRPKHVPYRDSRLTFLLQDSLGGNSKTTIIANVSPSISSAAETLNTLKFAQRAKLIQNNAIVNEDSSGDVIVLKQQIQLLKEELFALRQEKVVRSLSFGPAKDEGDHNKWALPQELPTNMPGKESTEVLRVSCKQLKSLESTLAGALRREKMAETSIKQLEAEIEQLNRLVSQREEESRCTKMMLKFREDKIQRMESLLGGLVSADDYLLKENGALSEEIQLLRDRIGKNPEVTRFALENIRLLEQVRKFQDLYEEGEREMLMTEVAELRNQLILLHDGKHPNHLDTKVSVHGSNENDLTRKELKRTLCELEESKAKVNSCLEENAKLRRELQHLHGSVNVITSGPEEHDCSAEVIKESIVEVPLCNNPSNVNTEKYKEETSSENLTKHTEAMVDLQLELDILKIILEEERSYRDEAEKMAQCLSRDLQLSKETVTSVTSEYEKVQDELKKAKLVIEALESQQLLSINEMEDLKNSNFHFEELVKEKELEISSLKKQAQGEFRDLSLYNHSETEDSPLEAKLKKMHASLERAKRLNLSYKNDLACQASNDEETEEVRKQVEAETAEVIVCLQEELSLLQQEVQDSKMKEMETRDRLVLMQADIKALEDELHLRSEDNTMLSKMLEDKESQLRTLTEEWDLMAHEIETVLSGGQEALKDASDQIDVISTTIPYKRSWISEQCGRMKKYIVEKELVTEELNRCLKDVTDRKNDLECMMRSLRGAALVMTEAHQQECSEKDKDILLLKSELNDKLSAITELEGLIKHGKDQIRMTSSCATAALVIVNRLSELNSNYQAALGDKNVQLREFQELISEQDANLKNQASLIDEADKRNHSLQMELVASEEHCSKLGLQLSEEQRCSEALHIMLEKTEENKILETKEKLKELNSGVLNLKLSMNEYVKQNGDSNKDSAPEKSICSYTIDASGSQGVTTEQDISHVDSGNLDSVINETSKSFNSGTGEERLVNDNILTSKSVPEGVNSKDATIVLLKQEIESALRSLGEVQAEMGKLRNEREEFLLSEKRGWKSIESLTNLAALLEDAIDNFEGQVELKVNSLESKLEKMEKNLQESCSSWFEQRELLEAELDDAKLAAAQKTIEASCVLEKFEEVQDTMKEADIMINELMIANEALKLSSHELKVKESNLSNERDILGNEVQSLRLLNSQKDQQCRQLEKEYDADFVAMKGMLLELEVLMSQVQTTSVEEWKSLASDLCSMKSQVLESTKSIESMLEEIWSEIIVKDCAVSVLHLCHMGILLETANGLHAENGLLHHGLSESNSVISELREQNVRSRRELEMCRALKVKLLADLKKGYDRISGKVDEDGEITLKLTSFEKKIQDLQFQEEAMLQRSNAMGAELAILMQELDLSNKQALASITDQERLLKDKDEQLDYQEDCFSLELTAKDFEMLVYSSELQKLQNDISLLEMESRRFKIVLEKKDEDLGRMQCIEKENEILQDQLNKQKEDNFALRDEIENKNAEFESSHMHTEVLDAENLRLRESISVLESSIATLEKDLHLARVETENFQLSQSVAKDDLCLRIQDLQMQVDNVNALKEENILLRNELEAHKISESEYLSALSLKNSKNVDLAKNVDTISCKILHLITEKFVEIDGMFQKTVKEAEEAHKIMEQFCNLENLALQLDSEIVSAQMELSRKDDVLKGLLFDLSLLQESASNNKDQKDELEELMARLKVLERDFELKTLELDRAVAEGQTLEAELQEKRMMISALQLDIAKEKDTIKSLSCKNEEALELKNSMEKELTNTKRENENLEMEVAATKTALAQMHKTIESLKSSLDSVTNLAKELEMARALAAENEAIAIEAQEIAEFHKVQAEEKEEQAKLMDKSIDELERTIDVLEQQLDILKGEAERQRLQREELELELQAVKEQMQNVKSIDSDTKRCLDEKEKNLQEALQRVELLQKEIAARDAEISQCKAHICELNVHAEAQASEYKQKFKALEAMVEKVKSEVPATHTTGSSANKLEKNASKPRGSGSPFKCIGLGIAQQIKSEKEEELSAGRQRIEELEALVASRQKEIFMLNARLAATESMTHDVIRDLLGVKLNINNYATLMDNQQLQSLMEEAQKHNAQAQVKEQEVDNLKLQINEFIKERNGWLEEIERKQAEVMAAHVALEKLRREVKLHVAENEMLKMEKVSLKKRVTGLEEEVKKLSGQQNIQQRIHHHAKIKEENNSLRSRNEDLSFKLQKTESVLSRVQEELAKFRAANGMSTNFDYDEEQRLDQKLKEKEDERLQLAQKLLGLCTAVLKAAGITRPTSEISLSEAEEALEQLKNRLVSQEMELQDAKLKNRILDERVRLSELRPQTSTASPRTDDDRQSHNRVSQAPFLSAFDR